MSNKGKRNHHYWQGFNDGKECPAIAKELARLKRQILNLEESVEQYKSLSEKRRKTITGLQRYNLELRGKILALNQRNVIHKKPSFLGKLLNYLSGARPWSRTKIVKNN